MRVKEIMRGYADNVLGYGKIVTYSVLSAIILTLGPHFIPSALEAYSVVIIRAEL
jgi:hypothetical protein